MSCIFVREVVVSCIFVREVVVSCIFVREVFAMCFSLFIVHCRPLTIYLHNSLLCAGACASKGGRWFVVTFLEWSSSSLFVFLFLLSRAYVRASVFAAPGESNFVGGFVDDSFP